MYNSFGLHYRFTTWGESHGDSIGVILDGVPAGLTLNQEQIHLALARRRPGTTRLVSARKESDEFTIHSGLLDGVTTGAPLSFLIRNRDANSDHYADVMEMYRPGHADYSWERKYGMHDVRGGGRSSARETVGRVIAGEVAKQLLPDGIQIHAQVDRVGKETRSECFSEEVLAAKQAGDSVGARVLGIAEGVPAGLGEPIYEKLDARLAFALMSIPAVKAVEIGSGVDACMMTGSEHNDAMSPDGFLSNHCGGILGGVSTGTPIVVKVTFKPTSSIFLPQSTVDRANRACTLKLRGRHDPCVGLRAPVIVEAMMACVLWDFFQLQRLRRHPCA